MNTDFRALCAELTDALDWINCSWNVPNQSALVERARTALAEPEPEGPTDEELTQLLFEGFRGRIEFLCDAEEEAHLMIDSHVKFARAVLARWGTRQPAPPAEGPTLDDIWELCEEHGFVLGIDGANEEESANGLWAIARAVLARWGNHPGFPDSSPQPVPVSERLPGPEDCDAEGRCWWGDAGGGGFVPSWRLCEQPDATHFTHWRPAHALPLPGEVDHG